MPKVPQKRPKFPLKSPRVAKSDVVKGEIEPEVEKAPPQAAPTSRVTVKTSKKAIDVFEGAPAVPERDELRPDKDLLEEEKAKFKELLDQQMSLAVRAEKLVKLACMTGNKTAPVALRAIQVINEITGVSKEVESDAPSMFNLPEGVHVKVEVEVPEK